MRTARGVVSEERGRADDSDARAPFLSNTADERVELLWIFMLDRSLALRLRLGPWLPRVRIAHEKFVSQSRARAEDKTLALFFKATRLRNALNFSGSVPIASSSATNAVDYAKFRGRSCRAVIRVYDAAGNVIETHEHAGDFKEPLRAKQKAPHAET